MFDIHGIKSGLFIACYIASFLIASCTIPPSFRSFFHAIHQIRLFFFFACIFSRGVVKNIFKNLCSVPFLSICVFHFFFLNKIAIIFFFFYGSLIRQCERRDSKTLPVIHNMPCTQKTLGVPRLFHATTKIHITKVRTTTNGIKASVLKFSWTHFFLFASHTCTQRSRCSSFITIIIIIIICFVLF